MDHPPARMDTPRDAAWPEGSTVALVIVGLALFWQLLRHTNLTALFSFVNLGGLAVTPDAWVGLFYAAALACALAGAVGSRRLTRVALRPPAVIALGTAASCCAVGAHAVSRLFTGALDPRAMAALQLVEAMLCSTVLCVLASVWAQYCGRVRMHPRWMLLAVLGSSFTGIVLAAVVFKPLPDKRLLSSLIPLAACLLGAAASRSLAREADVDRCPRQEAGRPSRASRAWPTPPVQPATSSATPPACATGRERISTIVFIAVLVVSTCAKAVFDTLLADATPDGLLQVKDAVTVAVIALVMVSALAMGGSERFLLTSWVVLSLAIVASLLVTPLAGGGVLSQIGVALASATRVSCEAFILAAIALRWRGHPRSLATMVFRSLLVPELASCCVGYGVLPLAVRHVGGGSIAQVKTVSLAVGVTMATLAFAVVLALALRLMAKEGTPSAPGSPDTPAAERATDPSDGHEHAGVRPPSQVTGPCEHSEVRGASIPDVASAPSGRSLDADDERRLRSSVATRNLTERELVIARYLLCGYSAARIAELECVTTNTVHSQTRSLYRKLDVHSRQQLIDLVRSQTA